MKTRCPACGATASLEVLIAHDAASHAIGNAFKLSGQLGKHLLQYLGLFRSGTRELSFDRVSKILQEILPDLEREQIKRDGVTYPAHAAVWIFGIEQALKARDDGRLTLPLKSHGWLYAVMATFQADKHVNAPQVYQPPKVNQDVGLAGSGFERFPNMKVDPAIQAQLDKLKNLP